jgi:hypothetical protein
VNLTRSQYESAYGHAILYFSMAVGVATAVQVALLIGTSWDGVSSNPWLGIVAGLVLGVLAIIVAGMGSAIVTISVGLILTVGLGRLLRRVDNWRIHVASYFGIGVLAAMVPVALYLWAVLSSEPLAVLEGDWLTLLDLTLVLVLAGLSTSLAWHHAWRRSVPTQRLADEARA